MHFPKSVLYQIVFLLTLIVSFSFLPGLCQQRRPAQWCDHALRPGLEKLKEIKISSTWFKVYDVGHQTYAITEPYNWEETISYLIIGKQKALLFDTGMGLSSIAVVVKQLTSLPVVVINSHTHPDHIGGNAEFKFIYALNTSYTRINAAFGYTHEQVKWEVSPASFCLERLPQADTAHYHIRPFQVTRYVNNGEIVDLGDRKLKIIATPGHTPDALCLYEYTTGYLWCGDSFYAGPILLTDSVTDLAAYKRSIGVMASYARRCNTILPAHNLPMIQPGLIAGADSCFRQIISGIRKGKNGTDGSVTYDCGMFSYQIGRKFLAQFPKALKK